MSFWSSFKKALSDPYPIPESYSEEVRGMLIASIIVACILFLFKPFGLSNYQGSILLISLAFGGVTFIVGLIYSLFTRVLFKKYGNQENQTLGLWILHVMGLIICITVGNVLFLSLYFQDSFSLTFLLHNLIYTALIGIFPITFFGFQNQLKLEKKNTQKALEIYNSLISNQPPKGGDKSVIMAIQAMENYIHIFSTEGYKLEKTTKRQTLQSAGESKVYQSLIKCHRSYLFNPSEVKKVSGNAQGLKLEMNHPDCPIIPVSRSYIEIVRASVNQ